MKQTLPDHPFGIIHGQHTLYIFTLDRHDYTHMCIELPPKTDGAGGDESFSFAKNWSTFTAGESLGADLCQMGPQLTLLAAAQARAVVDSMHGNELESRKKQLRLLWDLRCRRAVPTFRDAGQKVSKS